MNTATDLAERFETNGETDPLGFFHALSDLKLHRVFHALEAGEPDRAVSIAEEIHPEHHPSPSGRAHHWIHYGRALAQVGGCQSTVWAVRP